jgi:glycosyltransferase involved in cell wall biosynthesis
MKITLLCSNLRLGGIQRTVLTLADGLAGKDDLSVDLAVLRGRGEFLSLHSAAVNVVDLDCSDQPFALLSPFSRLAGYLKKAQPDVLLSFGSATNCLAAWAKLLRRLPCRLFLSGRSPFSARARHDAGFRRWRRVAHARFLYKQAELCICVSRGVADDLAGLRVLPRRKLRVISNPVNGSWLAMQLRDPVDHPWMLGANEERPPVILSVGRLMRFKGLDTLIRAFAQLRHEMRVDARLMIIGEGGDRGRLEALTRLLDIDRDVCFTGYLSNPCAYMVKSALVVLASHSEGFPGVLAEALTCGVNIVSTDCKSGPREILENGKWGRLVPVGDAGAMAEAMQDALRSPLPAEGLRTRATAFTADRVVDAYYDLICNDAPPSVKNQNF